LGQPGDRTFIGKRDGYEIFSLDGKRELMHRIVMEAMIGRPLLPNETVHHKNGIRHDNRPENLELWSSNHGGGQRFADLPHIVAFAPGLTSGLLSLAG
jgi:hypothetical protein